MPREFEFHNHKYMRAALALAKLSLKDSPNEVPVGAIIVDKNGKILSGATNRVENDANSTSHAEIIAIREASKILGTKYLENCDLYVTLEPCMMCAGAISHARIQRLYIGAEDTKFGAVINGVKAYSSDNYVGHKPEIYSGIMEDDCSEIITGFFAKLRGK